MPRDNMIVLDLVNQKHQTRETNSWTTSTKPEAEKREY